MPGIKIKISTEEAQTAVRKLAEDLGKLGASAKLTEQETNKLQQRMTDKMSVDKGEAAFRRIADSIGMTKKEMQKFHDSLAPPSMMERITRTGAAIKQHWLGISIAAGTATYAIAKAYALMEEGGRAIMAENAWGSVAKSMKINADEVIRELTRMTNATIDNSDLMQKAVKGIAQGLDKDDLIKIAAMARQVAITQGQTVGEAWERIIDSIANQQTRGLKQYGLLSKESLSVINEAIRLGRDDVDMLKYAWAEFQVQQAKTGPVNNEVAESLQRGRVAIKEMKENLGKFLDIAVILYGKIAEWRKEPEDKMPLLVRWFGTPEAIKKYREFVEEEARKTEAIRSKSGNRFVLSPSKIAELNKELGGTSPMSAEDKEKLKKQMIDDDIRKNNDLKNREAEAARFATTKQRIDNELALTLKNNELQSQANDVFYQQGLMSEADYQRAKVKLLNDATAATIAALQREYNETKESFDKRIALTPKEAKFQPDIDKLTAEKTTALLAVQGRLDAARVDQKKNLNAGILVEIDLEGKALAVQKEIASIYQSIAGMTGDYEAEYNWKVLILDIENRIALRRAGIGADEKKAIEDLGDQKKIRESDAKVIGDMDRWLEDLNREAETYALTGKLEEEAKVREKILEIEKQKMLLAAGQTDEQKKQIINLMNLKKESTKEKPLGVAVTAAETRYGTSMKSYNLHDKIAKEADLYNRKVARLTSDPNWMNDEIKKAELASLEWDREHSTLVADHLAMMADYYSQVEGMEDEYRIQKLASIEAIRLAEIAAGISEVDATKKANAAIGQLDQALFANKTAQISAGLQDLQATFESLANMYDKNSEEYAEMQTAANNMLILQKAVAVANAVAAIANQGMGDPYTAFARIAAMAAAMMSLLGTINERVNGATQSRAVAAGWSGNSGVLGGKEGDVSESTTRMWELLEDTYSMEYQELRNIYEEMQALNNNITAIVRGVVSGYPAGFSAAEAVKEINHFSSALSDLSKRAASFSLAENLLGNLAPKLFDKIDEALFGSTTSWTSAAGLSIRNQGTYVAPYTTTITESKAGIFGRLFGGGDETTYSTIQGAANEELANLFGGPHGIFTNIKNSLVEFAKGFGTDVQAALNYTFADVDINLLGLDAAGVQKALTSYFSAVEDQAVKALFGNIVKMYQEVGESLAETASRLLIDKVVVMDALEMTGQSFSGTAVQAVELSESLIDLAGGLSEFREAAEKYYEIFYTDLEKANRQQEKLKDVLEDLNMVLPLTKEGFRELVEGLDLTIEGNKEKYLALISIAETAGSYFSTIEDAISGFHDKFYTEKEKTIIDFAELTEAFSDLGLTLPSTRQQYRQLADSLDRTSDAGKKAYDAMMMMSDAADNYYNAMASVLQESINSQGETVSTLKAYSDKLKGYLKSLSRESDQVTAKEIAAARSKVGAVLSQARAGDFSGIDKIDDALSMLVQDANSTKRFASYQDYQRNYLMTKNTISELQKLTEDQLTNEEKTLSLLEKQLKALNDINTNISGLGGIITAANGAGVLTQLGDTWAQIASSIDAVLTGSDSALRTTWNELKGSIAAMLASSDTRISGTWADIKGSIDTILTNSDTATKTAWDSFKASMNSSLSVSQASLGSTWGDIKTAIDGLIGSSDATLRATWNSLKLSIDSSLSASNSTMGSTWNDIRNAITALLGDTGTVMGSAWNDVKTAIDAMLNSTGNSLTAVWANIQNAITGLSNDNVLATGQALISLKGDIESMMLMNQNLLNSSLVSPEIKGSISLADETLDALYEKIITLMAPGAVVDQQTLGAIQNQLTALKGIYLGVNDKSISLTTLKVLGDQLTAMLAPNYVIDEGAIAAIMSQMQILEGIYGGVANSPTIQGQMLMFLRQQLETMLKPGEVIDRQAIAAIMSQIGILQSIDSKTIDKAVQDQAISSLQIQLDLLKESNPNIAALSVIQDQLDILGDVKTLLSDTTYDDAALTILRQQLDLLGTTGINVKPMTDQLTLLEMINENISGNSLGLDTLDVLQQQLDILRDSYGDNQLLKLIQDQLDMLKNINLNTIGSSGLPVETQLMLVIKQMEGDISKFKDLAGNDFSANVPGSDAAATMADSLLNELTTLTHGFSSIAGTKGGAFNSYSTAALQDLNAAITSWHNIASMPQAPGVEYGDMSPLFLTTEKMLRILSELAIYGNLGTSTPVFAEGGEFGGGWRVVGEEGPELEYTGPSQIFSNSASKNLLDNSALVDEVRELRKELARFRSESKAADVTIARNTGKFAKVADRWDVDGIPAERTIT